MGVCVCRCGGARNESFLKSVAAAQNSIHESFLKVVGCGPLPRATRPGPRACRPRQQLAQPPAWRALETQVRRSSPALRRLSQRDRRMVSQRGVRDSHARPLMVSCHPEEERQRIRNSGLVTRSGSSRAQDDMQRKQSTARPPLPAAHCTSALAGRALHARAAAARAVEGSAVASPYDCEVQGE